MEKDLRDTLQTAYGRLEAKKDEVVHALTHRMFRLEAGWYNGHYNKSPDGAWRRDAYPIPVVSVTGLCDIEIGFDALSVSTKLKRDAALSDDFERLFGYEFEIYGVRNYLSELYRPGMSMRELRENIRACGEAEIGFSFSFHFDTTGEQILALLKLLSRGDFYS